MPYCSECGHEIGTDAKFCEGCGHEVGSLHRRGLDPIRHLLSIGVIMLIIVGVVLALNTARTRSPESSTPPKSRDQVAGSRQLAGEWRFIPLEASLWSDVDGGPWGLVIADKPADSPGAALNAFIVALTVREFEEAAGHLTRGRVSRLAADMLTQQASVEALVTEEGPMFGILSAVNDANAELPESERTALGATRRAPPFALFVGVEVEEQQESRATASTETAFVVKIDDVMKWAAELTAGNSAVVAEVGEKLADMGGPDGLADWRWMFPETAEHFDLEKIEDRWLIVSPESEPGSDDVLRMFASALSDTAASNTLMHEAAHASCLANMKQLSSAARMYAQDHDERFPLDWRLLKREDVLWPYVKASGVYDCPVDDTPSSPSYAAWPRVSGASIGSISDPVMTPLITEVQPDGESIDWRHLSGSGRRLANWAYVDGHCMVRPEGYRPQ